MKIGCGVDIIEVSRIQDSIETLGERFLDRIYTKEEIDFCNSKGNMKYQHFAARFAAKEAIYKAISELFNDKFEISWKNVQIVNIESGKPIVEFIDVSFDKIKNIDISLSHIKEYAIANCMVLMED